MVYARQGRPSFETTPLRDETMSKRGMLPHTIQTETLLIMKSDSKSMRPNGLVLNIQCEWTSLTL